MYRSARRRLRALEDALATLVDHFARMDLDSDRGHEAPMTVGEYLHALRRARRLLKRRTP